MLIFDRFPSLDAAERFAGAVRANTGRSTFTYTDAREAAEAAIFPYELVAPVVLVERHGNASGEQRLERLVEGFGGSFAGT